jgi:RNA recognition motif-containing protein
MQQIPEFLSQSEDSLRTAFSEFGTVIECKLHFEKETGKPSGVGYVIMSEEDCKKALDGVKSKPGWDKMLAFMAEPVQKEK